jgi:hypothetical protein
LSAFGDDERLRALRQKAEGRRQKEERYNKLRYFKLHSIKHPRDKPQA